MELQAAKIEIEELKAILENNKSKIVLLQDVTTKSISCSRCGASGDNSNEIQHDSCCPYIGGPGC